jgi:hypothetical protein
MMALSLLDRLRLAGFTATRNGEHLRVQPASLLSTELLAEVKKSKAEVMAGLAAEAALGLPLHPPDYAVPPEWQPAPDWTAEEAAVWSATVREMARALTDGDLVEWCRSFGARLYVDEKGLRAENAARVPREIRDEVRARQSALAAVINDSAGKAQGL